MKYFSVVLIMVLSQKAYSELADADVLSQIETTTRAFPNQCTAADRIARQELVTSCIDKQEQLGLSESIPEEELIPNYSCPAVEPNLHLELLKGCKDLVIDLATDIPQLIISLFRDERYIQEILRNCGQPPAEPAAIGNRFETLNSGAQRRMQQIHQRYVECNQRIRSELNEKKRQLEQTLNHLNQLCASENPIVRHQLTGAQNFLPNAQIIFPSRESDDVRQQCMMQKAEESGCGECVQLLSSASFSRELINSIYNGIKSYGMFQCFKPRIQGYMLCEVASMFLGSSLLTRAASRVSRVVNGESIDAVIAQARLTGNVSASSLTSSSVVGSAVASTLRSIDDILFDAQQIVGRQLSEEEIRVLRRARERGYDLVRNATLSDSQRFIETARLLGKSGLTTNQQNALLAAHNIQRRGSDAAFGGWTQAELREKTRILIDGGFTAQEVRIILDSGMAGGISSPFVGVGTTPGQLGRFESVGQSISVIAPNRNRYENHILAFHTRDFEIRDVVNASNLAPLTSIPNEAQMRRQFSAIIRSRFPDATDVQVQERVESLMLGRITRSTGSDTFDTRYSGLFRDGQVTSYFPSSGPSPNQILQNILNATPRPNFAIANIGGMPGYRVRYNGYQYFLNLFPDGRVSTFFPECGPGVFVAEARPGYQRRVYENLC